ncbi:MAG: mismatch-specific DNA-glycosylase [Chloroflexi bacterium]|nr:mismatch-specific DNA-glycosylase [Chloroflexota bacterium]
MTDFETLPDYLRPALDIVLVGLNPSDYSVRQGHYFANPRNRFWAAFNRSGLVGEEMSPELDFRLIDHGIGLTDVVKRPTPQGSGLKAEDYRRWAPVLKEKLLEYAPNIVCFQGVMGYGQYLRYAEGTREKPQVGRQCLTIGRSQVFVVPNPSPANAQYSLDDLVYWFRELLDLRTELAK